MFHESLKKQFNWNLMLKYTVKSTLNQYFMKYSERKISQCILPFITRIQRQNLLDKINLLNKSF